MINPKDKCKKCQGECVTQSRKVLELYIPRGSKYASAIITFSRLLTNRRGGDKIKLEGEADQLPEQKPGDIVFTLIQSDHAIFQRSGSDLCATIDVTLAEALCGFDRVVIKHLDGRGIQIRHPRAANRVLEPGQVVKVAGEGMPHKKSDLKGDLYLIIHVRFPDYSWLEQHQALSKLKELLPKPNKRIEADVVDDVEYDETAGTEDFGANQEPGGGWEDEEEEDSSGAQCQQQ